jgi:hypothetical protein
MYEGSHGTFYNDSWNAVMIYRGWHVQIFVHGIDQKVIIDHYNADGGHLRYIDIRCDKASSYRATWKGW